MNIPLKDSNGLVLLSTVATARRLGLDNVGVITPQVGTNALYLPMVIEQVTTRYIDNLKFCLYDCRSALGKFFSRELDKNKREWESTLTNDPKHRFIVDYNADRLDKLLQRHIPRRVIFSPNNILSKLVLAILNTLTQYRPNGFQYFNGYEKDLIAKAYFTYRLVHLCMQAEQNGHNVMLETLRCRYTQSHDDDEQNKITACYDKMGEWQLPDSWASIAMRTKQLVDIVACDVPYDDKEQIRRYAIRVTKGAPLFNLLELKTEKEMQSIVDELQSFNIIEPKTN